MRSMDVLWEEMVYMDTSWNRGCHLASRVDLEDFTDDALTISAGSLFQMLEAYWRIVNVY